MNPPIQRAAAIALAATLCVCGLGTSAANGQVPSGPPPQPVASSATGSPPATGAAPAQSPASLTTEINSHLPGWLRLGGEYRLRWEDRTGQGGAEGKDDGYLLSRLRLDLTLRLGEHWKVFLQGQDAHVGGFEARPIPATHVDDFDLRQAFVEYRQHDKAGFSLRIGRQELSYGDQRVVGASNWTNTARSFDAVKLGFAEKRFAVDVFASSVVVVQDDRFDRHFDGNNFYGMHASLFSVVPKSELNGYVYWKTTPFVLDERGHAGDADTFTYGTRLVGKPTTHLDYGLELIGQRGSFAGDRIRAGAAHGRLGYALSAKPAAPKLRVEYNFATGDASPGDGVRGTYDQLFPTNHDKYGIVDQVGYRNLHNVRAGVTVKPTQKLSVEIDYNSFWLARRRDGLYNAAGLLVARMPAGAPDAHVAQEADVQLVYTLREGLAFGAGYGHWFPGAFWREATPGASQSFAYSYVSYRF